MSLIKCPDCGKMISPRAVACPECGCPAEFFSEQHKNSRSKFINILNTTVRISDISSVSYKNASTEFLAPFEKLESIIREKKSEQYSAESSSKGMWITPAVAHHRMSKSSNLASEVRHYEHVLENKKSRINAFDKKYELAKRNELYKLEIQTSQQTYKFYNATANFDIKALYEEIISSL